MTHLFPRYLCMEKKLSSVVSEWEKFKRENTELIHWINRGMKKLLWITNSMRKLKESRTLIETFKEIKIKNLKFRLSFLMQKCDTKPVKNIFQFLKVFLKNKFT